MTAHVVGRQLHEMIDRFRAGDLAEARRIDEELRPAIDLLRVQTNPIAIKTAMNLLGHDLGGFRLPLVTRRPRRKLPFEPPRAAWVAAGRQRLRPSAWVGRRSASQDDAAHSPDRRVATYPYTARR